MPCSDVTDRIVCVFDAADLLKSYELRKKTCGAAVGNEALLQTFLAGRTADEILALDPDAFCDALRLASDIEEFLALKHLFSLQEALRVALGRQPGGAGEPCVMARVAYDDEDLIVEAEVSVDLVTERIRACGRCKTCAVSNLAALAGHG